MSEKIGFDIRRDTIRVFEEQDKIIQKIISKNKFKKTSEAYKEALRVWSVVHVLEEENALLQSELEEVNEKLAEINHKLNLLLNK